MSPDLKKNRTKMPIWLKTSLPGEKKYFDLLGQVKKLGLNTVCQSASCPNRSECWSQGTLSIMILGDSCSRACLFCDVPTGKLENPSLDEPVRVARLLSKLNLKYVVITSVDRDDLDDGGATVWAETIRQIRKNSPDLKIETLIPDFRGDESSLTKVCQARPDVLSHNIETVFSLQKKIRPQCRYDWSLKTLRLAYEKFGLITKSGIMLGHGETQTEIVETMKDLRDAGCSLLSIGQYLRPSPSHLEVVEYVEPDVFAEYKTIGESLGFMHVESGPLVRSSYRSDLQGEALAEMLKKEQA